jgi:hypothetical protein
MANSFHQFPLSEKASDLLSIITPRGTFRPKFMPEGVSPVSGYLQLVMKDIFRDFEEESWLIAIFDSILLLTETYEDAYSKFQRIIDRCYKRNVVLKMPKSWIGFEQAKFFGYEISQGNYCLGKGRKQAIMDISN